MFHVEWRLSLDRAKANGNSPLFMFIYVEILPCEDNALPLSQARKMTELQLKTETPS